MRFIGSVLLLFFGLLGAASAQLKPTNGYWWNSQQEQLKTGYIYGFFEGSGRTSLYWEVMNATAKTTLPRTDVTEIEHRTDFVGLRFSQVRLGLDQFYKDFQNLGIHVDEAIEYVRDQIKGTPETELQKTLSRIRANATKADYDK